jgi:hypothetical protein
VNIVRSIEAPVDGIKGEAEFPVKTEIKIEIEASAFPARY